MYCKFQKWFGGKKKTISSIIQRKNANFIEGSRVKCEFRQNIAEKTPQFSSKDRNKTSNFVKKNYKKSKYFQKIAKKIYPMDAKRRSRKTQRWPYISLHLPVYCNLLENLFGKFQILVFFSLLRITLDQLSAPI